MPYLQSSSHNPFPTRRPTTVEYYELLLCITKEPDKKKARDILQECLPAWLRVINSFPRRPRKQIIKALNVDPNFSLQVTQLLRESIESMDSQQINRAWPEIHPLLEELLYKHRHKTDMVDNRNFLP